MGDEKSDASAVGDLATDVLEAAYGLRDALEAAEVGHRGIVPDRRELEVRVRAILAQAGWDIARRPT